MSFSLAALGGVTVRINDPGCVAKTFPDYFRVLDEYRRQVGSPRRLPDHAELLLPAGSCNRQRHRR